MRDVRAKERLSKGIWSQQVCSKRTQLVWGRGVIEDHLSREHYRQKFIGFKIGVDTEKFSKQESALLDKQEKWGLNINVIVYCWMDGWLCNKDTIFWGWGRRGGGGGGVQAEATIYCEVWWVLFEYSSFDHFPKRLAETWMDHAKKKKKMKLIQSTTHCYLAISALVFCVFIPIARFNLLAKR